MCRSMQSMYVSLEHFTRDTLLEIQFRKLGYSTKFYFYYEMYNTKFSFISNIPSAPHTYSVSRQPHKTQKFYQSLESIKKLYTSHNSLIMFPAPNVCSNCNGTFLTKKFFWIDRFRWCLSASGVSSKTKHTPK